MLNSAHTSARITLVLYAQSGSCQFLRRQSSAGRKQLLCTRFGCRRVAGSETRLLSKIKLWSSKEALGLSTKFASGEYRCTAAVTRYSALGRRSADGQGRPTRRSEKAGPRPAPGYLIFVLLRYFGRRHKPKQVRH